MLDADMPPTEFIAQDPTAVPGGPPTGRARARSNSTANYGVENGNGMQQDPVEMQNERAVQVLNRVREKLTGRDFKPNEELSYIAQVDKLLIEATKLENLCQHYIGWCSFW
jgi:FKBP12-rapamycin complex-associated protein